MEVDFILGDGEVAIEVKGSRRVDGRELRPMRAFIEDHAPRRALVVCCETRRRAVDGIEVVPYRDFFRDLWDGAIIS